MDPHLFELIATDSIGEKIYALAAEIYPICRSITGNGVRETLQRISAHIPLDIHEVPTGTKVFDWIVPREWNIRDAYIRDERGKKIVDYCSSNLHVVSYSTPVRQRVSLAELKKHLHTLPEQPDLIPYRTSYYVENWGLCIPHRQLESLPEEMYEVVIELGLEDGSLTYGQHGASGRFHAFPLRSVSVWPGHKSLRGVVAGTCCQAHLRYQDALQLPLLVRPGNYRCDHLAGLQRG